MGSVLSDAKCPKCDWEHATSDFYYKIGIEFIFCSRCGYYEDYPNIYNQEKDLREWHECVIGGGFGCFRIMFSGFGSLSSFEDAEDYNALVDDFKSQPPHVWHNTKGEPPTELTATFYDEETGKWMLHNLLEGTIVEFDTLYEDVIEE